MAKKFAKDKKEEEIVMTEEQMRKIDAYLLEEAKKFLWIALSAILTAMIINQLISMLKHPLSS